MRRLDAEPALAEAAADTMLIGVTSFFRDELVFQFLDEWLAAHPPVRVLSAGCSDGPELVSVAMMLAARDQLRTTELIGADARIVALDRAAAGVYEADRVARVPGDLRRRYFQGLDAGAVRVSEEIRTAIEWRRADLTTRIPSGPWDLLLCRNLSIYLTEDAAQALWERLTTELAPGGLLVVGQAERPRPCLGLTRLARCIYLKASSASGELVHGSPHA